MKHYRIRNFDEERSTLRLQEKENFLVSILVVIKILKYANIKPSY